MVIASVAPTIHRFVYPPHGGSAIVIVSQAPPTLFEDQILEDTTFVYDIVA